MGASCCKPDPVEPTVEVYVDKLVKYVISPIVIILGFVTLVILYLGKDKDRHFKKIHSFSQNVLRKIILHAMLRYRRSGQHARYSGNLEEVH